MKQILIIIAIVMVFFLWRKKHKRDTVSEAPDSGQIQDSIIQMGSKGVDVRRMQMKMNELVAKANNEEILIAYSLDGTTFIPITQQIIVDGIFGRATETMLYALTGRKSIKASEIDSMFIAPAA